MVNILLKGAIVLVSLQLYSVMSAEDPDQYFLTISVGQSEYVPRVARVITRYICYSSKNVDVICKYLFKVTGEKTILAELDVVNAIELEKRLNAVQMLTEITVKTEQLTDNDLFDKEVLKVNESLLDIPANRPDRVNELFWCEVRIGYDGITLADMTALWKEQAELTLLSRKDEIKRDVFKITGENTLQIFTEVDVITVDKSFWVLPLFVENGANIKTKCRAILNLGWYS